VVDISNGVGTPLTTLGITAGEYNTPEYQASPSYTVPRWSAGQTTPRPTGSLWQKTNNVNLGTNLIVKKYNATLGTFVQQNCPVYTGDAAANTALDPSGGGTNIPAGTTVTAVSAGTVTISAAATGTTASVLLTFSGKSYNLTIISVAG
jgi:hypothetical protein